ncbi:PTS system, Lactose/Cellobiose specific IIB subunit [Raoultella terrigena]|uniref:PTS system, Lactose/Cellobiose specific IIB subunit n=1 Tax=Raoultella terrigena TaxID=577 RepID=A0A3P8JET1_RAOTE|nr:PTS system, Lactose/Cellobiose specific IIB subunit [Raoultella terrigena]
MKHMMICCGAGVATSTVALNKLQEFLKKENLLAKVRISQGTVAEAGKRAMTLILLFRLHRLRFPFR